MPRVKVAAKKNMHGLPPPRPSDDSNINDKSMTTAAPMSPDPNAGRKKIGKSSHQPAPPSSMKAVPKPLKTLILKRKARPGAAALREIKRYQRQTENFIARAPFQRYLRYVCL